MKRRFLRFFLAPRSPLPLACLRIGLALLLLAQAWMVHGSVLDLFSNDGFIQGELARAFGVPGTPKLSWVANWLGGYGVGESSAIHAVGGAYVASLVFFALGLLTPLAAVACWFLHWLLMNTGETTNYGVDLYAHVFLFYLMWMPSGHALSLDALWRRYPRKSIAAGLGLRVLQLHLCISYLFSAIEKAQGEQWWNGELLWRALTLPEYRQYDMTWIARYPLLPRVAGIGSLALEMLYFVFIWPRQTRPLWIAGIVGMHLGIAAFLGLHLFGFVMSLATLVAFGIPWWQDRSELEADPEVERGSRNVGVAERTAEALGLHH